MRLRAIVISLTFTLAGAGVIAALTEAAATPTIKTRHAALGTYTVDGKGRSLYLFLKDTTSKSKCYGSCAKVWRPLTVKGTPKAGGGLTASRLSTSKRKSGAKQVTYGGHPLYYFDGDSSAGDQNGQGIKSFGARWYVVAPSGKKITGGY
jgi:predicted lipoprotein with Yx(FWY)xxD motif